MKLNRLATYAWATVAYTLFVVVWGAYVRASSSGAGCGSHWPLCNGEVIPRAPQVETLIELTHRLTSGLALPLVVVLLVWVRRAFRKGHPARAGATLSLVFMLTEALIGAVLVRFELVAGNASLSRAAVLAVHLVNTFLLLATLALTAWWVSGGQRLRVRGQGALGWLFAAALPGALVLAVSGAVAALGDTLFPSNSLAEGLRQDFSATAHLLVRLRLLHPALAFVVGGLAVLTAACAYQLRAGAWVRRWALAVATLVLLQIAAGLLNVLLLAPIWLQLTHLLLADLLWLALVLLAASSLAESAAPLESFGRAPQPEGGGFVETVT